MPCAKDRPLWLLFLATVVLMTFTLFIKDVIAAGYEPVERPVFKKLGLPKQKHAKVAESKTPSSKKTTPVTNAKKAAQKEEAPKVEELVQPVSAPSGSSGSTPSFKLFGTVGFKRPVSAAPAWVDVIERNNTDKIFQLDRYFNKQVNWQKFKSEIQGLDKLAQLNKVNSFFNRFPYITDIKNWGKEDYWAAPFQFLKKSGDCEDYAIIKYFTLRELGYPADSMRIVVVQDTVLNEGHAVLAVNVDGKIYILDNLGRVVLPQERIRNYVPQFSVNELGRWNQIKTKNAKN